MKTASRRGQDRFGSVQISENRNPEAGQGADVAVRGSWICFSGVSEGSLH